ncbi:DUF885 domain-containing protein [Spirosoma sordidisoli]|uniref:DUF885 domain-containing protein n=1 Tax=Spirosoma sordidisoli TaxID=2502893 RepID=A0A4Q2UKK2_9BACT|nr:DUF885 domain-containing protein [Spirosoma sordidisoli]RYC67339.1 DUF885 domain-containing protein [Spirosoma sordidisoli]
MYNRLLLFLCLAFPAWAQTPDQRVTKVIADVWAFRLADEPLLAVMTGQGQSPDRLFSYSEAAFQKRHAFYQQKLTELKALPAHQLSAANRTNASLLIYLLDSYVSDYKLKTYLNPLLAEGGPHTDLSFIPAQLPFQTVADYERYIRMLMGFPAQMTEVVALLRDGLKLGMTQPRAVMEGYQTTYQAHIVSDPASSVFYKPFERMPATFSAADRERLKKAGRQAVMDGAVAGYRQFGAFMDTDYLPNLRTTLGASALPNGEAYYQERVRYYTTLDLTPDQVHQTGGAEVARIRAEMNAVMVKTGFTGSFADFLKFLRTSEQFYPKTAGQLLREASYIAKRADDKLPAFFGRLPRQPYGVSPVPDAIAPKYTAGRYVGAPLGGTTAGQYWVNTYNLPSRSLYTLEALTLHEAVPGHHLQTALSAELTSLPVFRRFLYVDAFGEGWGLYCEWLGREMGFYTDPYSDFGRLTYEMWRACRLVVDTGIHAKGWSREQAMQFMAENTALSLHEVRTEVDRYISWPGQALAYKTGEMKIKQLRKQAEVTLKERFDIRQFHDALLGQGTVTLPILEQVVADYIQKARK